LGAPINGWHFGSKKAILKEVQKNITFDTKETVLGLNGSHIETHQSSHIDAFRALDSPKFILLDEADFL
jgi:hypothetical protein